MPVITNKVPILKTQQILNAQLTKIEEYKIYVCIHSGIDVITITSRMSLVHVHNVNQYLVGRKYGP